MSYFGDLFHITFNYLLKIIYPQLIWVMWKIRTSYNPRKRLSHELHEPWTRNLVLKQPVFHGMTWTNLVSNIFEPWSPDSQSNRMGFPGFPSWVFRRTIGNTKQPADSVAGDQDTPILIIDATMYIYNIYMYIELYIYIYVDTEVII